MSSGITHFNKVSGVNGLYVGGNDAEVLAVSAAGVPAVAGTALTATGAEINSVCDVSANTETIAAAGALSVTLGLSRLALVGAGAVTLAAPDASMVGRTKVIEMTVDNGDVTLALTNVAGGSAATTCTWSAVGQALVLVAGLTKWCVASEAGVALT
jgi:hypothetical protein